eukprot:s2335_g17.t1
MPEITGCFFSILPETDRPRLLLQDRSQVLVELFLLLDLDILCDDLLGFGLRYPLRRKLASWDCLGFGVPLE